MKQEYSGITQRTKTLLKSGENKYVDYKERLKGLHAEDLVAFANSKDGGVILIGVKEFDNNNGTQIGIPCGCSIGDKQKLQIMGKALSCSPPVKIQLFIENLSKEAFYRIEIPSGLNKPYSINSGTYKIREDGRNLPLLPGQLLSMFLEKEGEEFRKRFSEASGHLESHMQNTLSIVGDLEDVISSKIEEIASSMGWAEYEASSARNTIDDVDSTVSLIANLAKKDHERMKYLLRKLEVKDPVVEKAKKEVLEYFIQYFEENQDKIQEVKKGGSLNLQGGNIADLNKEILSELLTKAIKTVEDKQKDK